MSDNEPFSLSIAPHSAQPERKFFSVEEFERWFQREQEFWSWLDNAVSGDHQAGVRRVWDETKNRWGQINESLHKLRHATQDVEKSNHLQQLRSELSRYHDGGIHLLSDNPKAKYVAEIAQREPEVAGFTLVTFIDGDLSPSHNQARGYVHAVLYDRELDNQGAEPARSALEQTRHDWDMFNQEAVTKQIATQTSGDEVAARLSTAEAELQVRFDNLYQTHSDTLSQIESTYDKKLAVQAPVSYWNKKAKSHRTSAKWWGLWFALAILAAGILLGCEIVFWLLPSIKGQTDTGLGVLAIATLATTATLIIWPIRILAKMLLSNVHLATDASERAVLTHTYLSLLRKDDRMEEADRQLILKVLFRPTSTGIVKDDGAPSGIAEIAARTLNK